MEPREALHRCLSRAVGSPTKLHSKEGGAVLALALHCMCIRAGLRTNPKQRGSMYAPSDSWNESGSEWVFHYQHPGCQDTIILHCALQKPTGRMYIQLRVDKRSGGSIFPLGLTLSRYIPDTADFQQTQWAGLMTQEDVLEQQVDEFCIGPLLEELPISASDTWLARCTSSVRNVYHDLQDRGLLPPVAIGMCAAAAAACAIVYWRSNRGQQGPWYRDWWHASAGPSAFRHNLKQVKPPK